MQKQYKITKERLKELQDELEYMKSVREKEVADQIKEARSFGDLSENSEYDEAKNEQGKLYSRMAEIEAILANYVIISDDDIGTNEVSTGTKVLVQCIEDDEKEEYYIVGTQEANPALGRISEDSPFGKALMGRTVGDEVTVEAPACTLHYKLLEISK